MLLGRAFQCTIVLGYSCTEIGSKRLAVCQMMDAFGLSTVRYNVLGDRNGKKVKCYLILHD